jgi:hypothetical protein
MTILPFVKEIDEFKETEYKYSICTLVSRPMEYKEMVNSFIASGFDEKTCEYLYIDNSEENKFDAFAGINKFLVESKGQYIIICHQDILIQYDNREVLEKRIKEIDKLDPKWAIVSNGGGADIQKIVIRVTETDKILKKVGHTPEKVKSVDENFILIKRKANLAVSSDLNGFHLYGTDLCIIAEVLGYTAYVINFNLLHKSTGKRDDQFYRLQKELLARYTKVFRGRFIQTTITRFYLSGSIVKNSIANSRFGMFLARKYFKNKFREYNSRKPE